MRDLKKLIISILVLCMVFSLAACNKKTEEQSNTPAKKENTATTSSIDIIEEPKTDEEVLYNEYANAVISSFNYLDTGHLYTVHYDSVSELDAYELDYERTAVDEFSFLRLNRHSFSDEDHFDDYYYGWLQKDGINYSYYQTQYEDGSVKWIESVATYEKKLPIYERLISTVPEYKYVKEISVQEDTENQVKVYRLVISPNYKITLNEATDIENYSVKDIVITTTYDTSFELVKKVLWTYTEEWEYYSTKIESGSYVSIEPEEPLGALNLNWFLENSTYIRPTYSDVTSSQRDVHINIPGKIIFDARIPEVLPQLPGADVINEKIATDYALELDVDEKYLASMDVTDYIVHSVDYEVYRFGNTYEICVFGSEGSAYGAGTYSWMNRYVYDALGGRALSGEEFLTVLGYDKDSFLEKLAQEYPIDVYGDSSPVNLEYEVLLESFYIKEDGTIYVEMDLSL